VSQIKKAIEKAKAERLVLQQAGNTVQEPIAEKSSPELMQFTRRVEIPLERLGDNKIIALDEDHPAIDHLKLLRTRIFHRTRPRGWNALQVTGFGQGEGKSTLAVNLAISIAMDTRQTTLLVDLDFRKPTVHKLLSLGPKLPGLKSFFLDGASLEEIMICPGIENLTVLPTGGPIPNAPELMGSMKMERLIRELKQKYPDRYIIFDTPAINLCPDPLIVSEYVDALIFVARVSKTSRDCLKAALDLVPREKVLGIVLNDCKWNNLPEYAYRYRYI
jgi:capsular exopolysaccharide synthesis family protein